MRRWIVIILIVLILGLGAAAGHFLLGWWRPSHAVGIETRSGFNAKSEHATLPEALAMARQALDDIDKNVRDYSAVIIKEERIGDKLVKTAMFAKIREKPFSVYLNILDRSDDPGAKGREVIFVQGRNGNKLQVHTPGFFGNRLGTLSLDPKGMLAMQGEHYPITEIGLANLCRQLIKRGTSAGDPSQVQVERYAHARINSRACTMLKIIYPVHEKKIWGYLAVVFVDNQWHFPIRVGVYELPRDRGKDPRLVEQYTYLDVKLNNGYSDADFDPKNRQYKFP